MLVTGVIPVHNHAHWVNDAVDSMALQTYRPLRIVVVDDGSSDGSTDAVVGRLNGVRSIPKNDEPKTYVGKHRCGDVDVMVLQFSQGHGPSFARNFGIRVGWEGTDVFAFLDSDDVYEPGKIARSVAKFQAAPDHLGVVYTDFDTIRPDGLRFRQHKEPFGRQRLLQECLVNCDSLISKKALEGCGLFDESLRVCEDYDLWLRISEKFMITHIPESLVTIRVGDHSSTSRIQTDVWKACYARVFQKLQERLSGKN